MPLAANQSTEREARNFQPLVLKERGAAAVRGGRLGASRSPSHATTPFAGAMTEALAPALKEDLAPVL
jgi:hypothetical protein